jgi:hypothetical protein
LNGQSKDVSKPQASIKAKNQLKSILGEGLNLKIKESLSRMARVQQNKSVDVKKVPNSVKINSHRSINNELIGSSFNKVNKLNSMRRHRSKKSRTNSILMKQNSFLSKMVK